AAAPRAHGLRELSGVRGKHSRGKRKHREGREADRGAEESGEVRLAQITHGCRSEAVETEARRGFSQVRTTQAYPQRYVEEGEREKPRRPRGSAAAVGIPGWSGRGIALSTSETDRPGLYGERGERLRFQRLTPPTRGTEVRPAPQQ